MRSSQKRPQYNTHAHDIVGPGASLRRAEYYYRWSEREKKATVFDVKWNVAVSSTVPGTWPGDGEAVTRGKAGRTKVPGTLSGQELRLRNCSPPARGPAIGHGFLKKCRFEIDSELPRAFDPLRKRYSLPLVTWTPSPPLVVAQGGEPQMRATDLTSTAVMTDLAASSPAPGPTRDYCVTIASPRRASALRGPPGPARRRGRAGSRTASRGLPSRAGRPA